MSDAEPNTKTYTEMLSWVHGSNYNPDTLGLIQGRKGDPTMSVDSSDTEKEDEEEEDVSSDEGKKPPARPTRGTTPKISTQATIEDSSVESQPKRRGKVLKSKDKKRRCVDNSQENTEGVTTCRKCVDPMMAQKLATHKKRLAGRGGPRDKNVPGIRPNPNDPKVKYDYLTEKD